jgi:YHS domain-containing protein
MRSFLIVPALLAVATAIGCSQAVTPSASTTAEPSAIVTEPEAATAESAAAAVTAEPVPSEATEVAATNEPAVSSSLLAVYAESGVAIAGADPVAYFTEGAYVPGSDQFAYDWSGTTWYFASAANRDAFANDPTAYAPQYGGFCAWAVSQGYSAPVDPNAWKIVDGKLYLNFDRSVQARWERDIPGHIASADANWPEVAASE